MAITLILLAVFLLADIFTKYFAELLIAKNDIVTAIPGVLDLTLTYNTGAAWSLFDDNTLFLAILSLVASIVIIVFIMKNDWKTKKIYSLSTCMLLAGTFGNMIDRFLTVFDLRDGVVDMIILNPLDSLWSAIFKSRFPIFNVADVLLVLGVILLAIDILFLEDKREKKIKSNINKQIAERNKEESKDDEQITEANEEEVIVERKVLIIEETTYGKSSSE